MKKKYITITFTILPILLGLICLIQVVKNNNQALMPKPVVHEFIGNIAMTEKIGINITRRVICLL